MPELGNAKPSADWTAPELSPEQRAQRDLEHIDREFTAQHEAALKEFFTYHAPTPDQQEKYFTIRDAAYKLSLQIEDCVPNGDDKKKAIDLLRSCVMTANQGIACKGLNYRI